MTTSPVPSYDYVWEQGEDKVLSFVYKSGSPPVAVNLTGYAVRLDIADPTNGQVLLALNSADFTDNPTDSLDVTGSSDNEATLDSQGNIQITLKRGHTLFGGALVSKIGTVLKYDMFLRDNSTPTKQRKILQGTIVIEASTTKWQ